MINKILFIVNKYPNKADGDVLVFVQQLAWSIADKGITVMVICPLALNVNPKYSSIPAVLHEKTDDGNDIVVYFPKFFGLGQSHYLFGRSPAPITTELFYKSVRKVIKKYNLQFDAVYGHFITPAGICASRIGKEYNVGSFVGYGESDDWSIKNMGVERVKKELYNITGIISVSQKNKTILIEYDVVPESKICIIPNGYRKERFYRMDKLEARSHFGWDDNVNIVGMVGSLIERKGPLRLQKAVDDMNDVFFACVGKGDQIPTSPKCIFCKPLQNSELVYFYNALDVFVLPTYNEGCCNAIVEALACGLPVVSSDKEFNYDILDKTCSILIDPKDTEAISEAIQKIISDRTYHEMLSDGSMKKSEQLTLEARAEKILNYMSNSNAISIK